MYVLQHTSNWNPKVTATYCKSDASHHENSFYYYYLVLELNTRFSAFQTGGQPLQFINMLSH